MTNLDKVIERNKNMIVDILAMSGYCISKGDYRIYTSCMTCTNRCKDCLNGESALRRFLKSEVKDEA